MEVRQAKDFLVHEAVEQARLENVPLSDLERRMMYFTEGPDATENPIELNEEFEKQHDRARYEAKVSKLFSNAYRRLTTESPTGISNWSAALETLEQGDHYLLVLGARRYPLAQISASIARLAVRSAALVVVLYVGWIGLRYLLRIAGIPLGSFLLVAFLTICLAVGLRQAATMKLVHRAVLQLVVFLIRR